MNDKKFIQDTIAETLLITLYMKYRESNKPNPIIQDATACKLVNEIPYNFDKFKKSIKSSVGTAIRANYFDTVTKAFIQKNQNPVVVLIGCGLDSRVERIGKVAEKATFYQLDIPEVMTVREKLIPKRKNEHYLHTSMLDTTWMEDICSKHPNGNFLFIIEGVFMYFAEKDVKFVFQNLAHCFPNGEFFFDIVNTWMSKNSHIHDTVKLTNAKFIYGTDDDRVMETWSDKLAFVDAKLFSDFPNWKRVGWQGKLMMLIPIFKKAGRMLHYRIK